MTGMDGRTRPSRRGYGLRLEFTNNSWGEKVCQLVQVTKKLGNSEWDQIKADCYLDHGVWFHQNWGVKLDNEKDHQIAKLLHKRHP